MSFTGFDILFIICRLIIFYVVMFGQICDSVLSSEVGLSETAMTLRRYCVLDTNGDDQRGTNYIRWGRKTCQSNATLVYHGISTCIYSYT